MNNEKEIENETLEEEGSGTDVTDERQKVAGMMLGGLFQMFQKIQEAEEEETTITTAIQDLEEENRENFQMLRDEMKKLKTELRGNETTKDRVFQKRIDDLQVKLNLLQKEFDTFKLNLISFLNVPSNILALLIDPTVTFIFHFIFTIYSPSYLQYFFPFFLMVLALKGMLPTVVFLLMIVHALETWITTKNSGKLSIKILIALFGIYFQEDIFPFAVLNILSLFKEQFGYTIFIPIAPLSYYFQVNFFFLFAYTLNDF